MASALGRPPNAGQAEAYASWRASWRALGRPEDATDEATMSVGKLRIRVRAYDREQTWAPAYVANELAGTRQAAERHRQTTTLRTTEAAAATDVETRTRLEDEATDAAGLAAALDQRVGELEQVDNVRADWLVHTAMTRANADRAAHELSTREADRTLDERPVTAEEWLVEHDQAMRAEDPHRDITAEHDLTDIAGQQDADMHTDRPHPDAADTVTADVRETTAGEPAQADIDVVRIPTAQETADTIHRAQDALTELEARRAHDEQQAAEDTRRQELARWQADTLDQTTSDQRAVEDAHAVELAAP
ncbi:MAG: hypothetical protein DLM59_16690 [Pseudonocardiales bacterium]|nr:MAG: hypothetical protein DLM59_16690 [Pseudonocardiales bacterium]